MKKLFTMFFVALLAFTLIGCGNDCEECEVCETCETCDVCEDQAFGYGVGYQVVHGHYVGVAKVVVDEDDAVVSVDFDEYYLPYSWAKVTPEDPENLPDTIVKQVVIYRDGNLLDQYYAKYLSVDGVLYTGTVTGDAPYEEVEGEDAVVVGTSQVLTYSATGVADFDVWVETPANAQSYVEAIEAGLVFIADETGAALDLVQADASAMHGWSKTVTPYWQLPGRGLGWGGNMKAIADALVGTTFDTAAEEIAQNLDNFWEIGDITTGATLSDFVDYYELAEAAYNAAVASKE